ncbi:MAG TPA: DUF3592 domain-containing protein [Propioniciclava tarda]|nr:DUF3592 domain-containing protein [Propioniciclava tarda]HQA29797.1 DUF3592 domain-containing protein [Propioniciclava tarda]HQD59786.1 DUF3592 domain-containing protein [Propioniciclava tarda]
MGVYAGPTLIIVPGLVTLLWAILAIRKATAAKRWTVVAGTIIGRDRDAHGPIDVVEYPLPEGGTRRLHPEPHGQYVSGRPLGTQVTVWRDPQDALEAVLELPRLERFAGQFVVGVLGAFFFFGGLIWAGLIWALVSR